MFNWAESSITFLLYVTTGKKNENKHPGFHFHRFSSHNEKNGWTLHFELPGWANCHWLLVTFCYLENTNTIISNCSHGVCTNSATASNFTSCPRNIISYHLGKDKPRSQPRAQREALSISCLVIDCTIETLDHSIAFPTSCVKSALPFFLSTCVWLKKKPGLLVLSSTFFSPEKHLALRWNIVKTEVQLTFSLKRCFIMTTSHWNYIIAIQFS